MKTALTINMEKALYKYSGAGGTGIYGCFEVRLGKGYGNESVDFMTMDSRDRFRCYEIKSSEEDFFSDATLSFVGDYNFLLIPHTLKGKIEGSEKLKSLLLHGVGILIYWENGNISYDRSPKGRQLTMAQRVELMHCMTRSLSRYCHHEFDKQEDRENGSTGSNDAE